MVTEHVTVSIKGMTCPGCVASIERALRQQEGVIWASINFAAGQATLTYDPADFGPTRLSRVIRELGYELGVNADGIQHFGRAIDQYDRYDTPVSLWAPLRVGPLAVVTLIGLYLGLLALAQDWQYAAGLLWGHRWLVGAVAIGSGIQVGLWLHLRFLGELQNRGRSRSMTGKGTDMSRMGLVAYSTHLTAILPILALAAACAYPNQYQIPLVLLGFTTNFAGIALMLRLILRMNTLMPHIW